MSTFSEDQRASWQRLDEFRGKKGAFGDPDGARADLDSFIEFGRELGLGDLSGGADGRRVRVIVGRKGSGKTVYLRRHEARVSEEPSLAIASPNEVPGTNNVARAEQTELMPTSLVLRVSHWISHEFLTETWMSLWRSAILSSMASYVKFHHVLSSYITADESDQLMSDFQHILRLGRDPRSPFTTMKDLITRHHSSEGLLATVHDPLWDDLENRLGQLLQNAPPTYVYIDAIDEEFAHAPMYWLRCQKGLFYETMRLLRNSRLGGRLHVVISVRDLVLSSVYRSEHGTRYRQDPHIQLLSWGYSSARYLLEQKCAATAPEFRFASLRGESDPYSLEQWTRLPELTNSLGELESVTDYALRHTQLLPRDVILIGNYLGDLISAARDQGRTELDPEEVRTAVSDLALFCGLAQLETAANQVKSDEIHPSASDKEYSDVYTSVAEYTEQRAMELIELLSEFGSLRLSRADLDRLYVAGSDRFGGSDVVSILWQNGLLGYTKGGKDVFYSLDYTGRFSLPRSEDAYVLHPTMVECAGLGPSRPAIKLW